MQNTSHSQAGLADELLALWLDQAREQAVLLLDPQGTIVGWRAGAETILGYAAGEVLGRPIALIFTEEDQGKGYPGFELQVATEDTYSEDSRWHVRKDGTRIWASGTVTALRGAQGEVLGYLKLMRDMTDLRAHTERTENEVSQLDDARRRTHNFLRTLGHEIRNPLAVLANVDHILDRVVADERGKKAIQQLRGQLAVLKRLADDLMDVSRLELGKMELNRQRIDLRELLNDVVTGLQPHAQAKSITLEALLPPAALWVQADLARIRQVVNNLLDNALKYTHVGGSVWVKASQEGNEIACRVQDTGIGIFPPVLPRLFELFTQAHEGEEMRGGGIGVGLALVRQIVELHGGTVQAKSPGLGKGAEFSFRLPVAAARGE